MTRAYELFLQGGPVMWPLLGLSVLTLTRAIERAGFWIHLLGREHQIVSHVLDAARYDWGKAAAIARQAESLPIGRFLLAPLQLQHPNPETFHLAMEAAADKEFIQMRKGNQFFEAVVGLSPLLGLLGTVIGLIVTFAELDIGNIAQTNTSQALAGISAALLTTAAGTIVAILALGFWRIFVSLQTQQMDYFFTVGNELELIYRQIWFDGE
ncbi:MotA/TolQ/ExbB proton channel family protein [Oscillatoriales cyanobacterium LEGE 11467]|uniref:MotA/TolQ/ExbB proton channel family protein n=1 Tax=Zarconia navalis LEGE 11467 TaxID=1828826 RepID=A0A928Z953_9CYAN|nr:MotA/TolQ/ExbB proton channel family protein [Zarconia navalis]MBE9042265.1 MotA/TolQ/ExbB proton channel family protein [Zarconia navalis LEGE 11467]